MPHYSTFQDTITITSIIRKSDNKSLQIQQVTKQGLIKEICVFDNDEVRLSIQTSPHSEEVINYDLEEIDV